MIAVSEGVELELELELSWLKGFEGDGGHMWPLVKLYIILGHMTIFSSFPLLSCLRIRVSAVFLH